MPNATLETLTAQAVRDLLGSKMYGRASGYLSHVEKPVRQGDRLTAVIGKSRKYQVEVTVLPATIIGNCTCPYDWGGHCKHVGALLRYWVTYPRRFEIRTGGASAALEFQPIGARKSYVPATPPAWVEHDFSKRQAEAATQLRRWLQHMTVSKLRAIGKTRGQRIKGARKDDVVAGLAQRLTDSAETGNVYHSLDTGARALLHAFLIAKPSHIWHTKTLLAVTQFWEKSVTKETLPQFVQQLQHKGVVLSAETGSFESIQRYGQLPPQIARALLPLLPPLLPTQETPKAQAVALADSRAFARSASQLARLIARAKPQLSKPQPRPVLERFYKALSGWPYDEDELAQVANEGQLSKNNMPPMTVPPLAYSINDAQLAAIAGEPARLEWLYRLMVAVGTLRPGTPVRTWETYADLFHQQSEAAQQAAFARAYFELDTWSELWDMLHAQPEVRLQRRPVQYYAPADLSKELVELRKLVLRTLATLPDNRWVRLSDLTGLLRRVWQTFSAAEFIPPHYFSYGQRDSKPNWEVLYQGKSAQTWRQPHTAFVQQVLQRLHWLGLTDLAMQGDQINGFRLQGLADLYWDRCDTLIDRVDTAIPQSGAVSPADVLSCDGDTVRLNPSAVSSQAHTFLESIATLDKALPDEFVYQLDVKSVLQTFETGSTLATLTEQWQHHFGIAPAATIAQRLAAWWDSYGQVRIHERVTLIEFADEFALVEMKAVTDLTSHLVAELSPTLVLITDASVDHLMTQLQQAGHTPKLTEQAK